MLNEHDDTLREWARIINFQKPTGHCRIWRQSECGKCFFGRSRPSKFQKKKKKDSHKLVWPSNYINIRLGWEFLKTIWVWKSFLGRRPYKLPLRFQNLACSFNFWQHAPRRQLSLNFWIRSNFFENSKGRTLFQAGIILWKSFSDSYVGGFFFQISESEAKEWMFPIQKE